MHSTTNSPIRKMTRNEIPMLLHTLNFSHGMPTLYIKGSPPISSALYICIVGSRKATPYGLDVVKKLIAEISHIPAYIVSGLAYGVDIEVHKQALAHGMICVAIPGSGLDDSVLYPFEHKQVAEEIISSGGCLISPFEPFSKPTKWTFPTRNHLMAGMSHVTIIIEGTEKSGSLITATAALEYNRTVCAIPGSIFSPHSMAPHKLITEGAQPISSGADIINLINQWHPNLISEKQTKLFFKKQHFKTKDINSIKNQNSMQQLSQIEISILSELIESKSFSSLANTLNISSTEILQNLSKLEIKGLIEQRSGMYKKC